MALKDWKNGGKYQWVNIKKKHNLAIELDKFDYVVLVENYKSYELVLIKSFRTKSAALKYARDYMRKH